VLCRRGGGLGARSAWLTGTGFTVIWRVIRTISQRRRSQAIFGAIAVLPMHLLFAVMLIGPQLCGMHLLVLALPMGLLCALALDLCDGAT
jgi:hypothetical protein